MTPPGRYDAVIVGAGISGLYLLHRLRGLGLSVRVIDQATGVGGTWFWNRYPGRALRYREHDLLLLVVARARAGVDAGRSATPPSRRSSRYLEHVADRFDLRRDIRLGTRVLEAALRRVGDALVGRRPTAATALSAAFLIMATGCLSVPRIPDIPGSSASPASCTTRASGRTRASTSPASASA